MYITKKPTLFHFVQAASRGPGQKCTEGEEDLCGEGYPLTFVIIMHKGLAIVQHLERGGLTSSAFHMDDKRTGYACMWMDCMFASMAKQSFS